MASAAASQFVSVDFEVFGNVQHVHFRIFTVNKAESLKLVGWCANTTKDTVTGCLQGPESDVGVMRNWLRDEGSPRSKIEKVVFSNERILADLEVKDFSIRTKKDFSVRKNK